MTSQKAISMEEIFSVFDRDGDGTISKDEFRKILEDIGLDVTPCQLNEFFAAIDSDHNGVLDFSEFCAMMHMLACANKEREEAYRKTFEAMDTDGDGKISAPELHKALKPVLEGLWPEFDIDDAKGIIKVYDKDGDMEIDYKEFCVMLLSLDITCEIY